jgi:hypothetical protein
MDQSNTFALMTVGDAAKVLELSPARVRQLVDAGVLLAFRDSAGGRLIPPAAVAAEAQRRQARRAR